MWSAACLLLLLQDPLPKFADAWVIGSTGSRGRESLPVDALEALRVAGTLERPADGKSIQLANGESRAWRAVKFSDSGKLDAREARGGHVFATVTSATERVAILHAKGHRMVFVQGEPRPGDLYNMGIVKLPVLLRKGETGFLFAGGRGALEASLMPAPERIDWTAEDATLPDLVVGRQFQVLGAVVVTNPTTEARTVLVRATLGQVESVAAGAGRLLPPFSVTKVPFLIRGGPIDKPGSVDLTLALVEDKDLAVLSPPRTVPLTVRAEEGGRRTFQSNLDGSIQYYASNPATPQPGDPQPALVLSLHGAGVEATGQAAAYGQKTWATLVAPTNRRPFGFDWEDWGAWDAMEVLDLAQRWFKTDPQRTYLTGHSMGGHGTWQIGGLFPDRFAAIGPSAGWISFATYGGGSTRPETRESAGEGAGAILRRARATCDTLAVLRNHAQHAVYVLHGDADDNVPVAQARTMREQLQGFHKDLMWHEQKGAGHWWDDSDEPGAACVDWPPMFDLFARRRIPTAKEVRDLDFTTLNPALSARCHWLTVVQQQHALEPSQAVLRHDPARRHFSGTTRNIRRLSLDLASLGITGAATVVLDGTTLKAAEVAPDGQLHLVRIGEPWQASEPPGADEKNATRAGPFKHAFRNRVLLVYGTQGTPAENAWALAKARFDAEGFWYRGNASLELIPDTRFIPTEDVDRNVVLYGHADMNRAWQPLFGRCPVQVTRGSVAFPERRFEEEGLACLLVHPRPGSSAALVGVVAGTGIAGLRATERVPYLTSGSGYPDCLVFAADAWRAGLPGVRAAGFFGPTWSVKDGDFVFAGQ